MKLLYILLHHMRRVSRMELGKTLVHQKTMSQSDTNIVQSSKDFANLVSRLMPSTTVLHIDQTIAILDPWKDVPAADGI